MRNVWIMLALIIAGAAPALAQVEKWVDDKGRVHYGDKPPSAKQSGSVQMQKAPQAPASGKASAKVKQPVAAPIQPKYAVSGDPLVARMKANEEHKQRESATASCWKYKAEDCTDPETIRVIMQADTKGAAAKPVASKPATREALPADFCKRNPRVPGCGAK